MALPLTQESQGNLVLPKVATVVDREKIRREVKERRVKVASVWVRTTADNLGKIEKENIRKKQKPHEFVSGILLECC